MSLDSDLLVDRRRIRRKLTFWRVLAVTIAIVGVGAIAARFGASGTLEDLTGAGAPYIARVKITGLIRNDEERAESLERLAKSNAKAVIVHVDSPGGTTAGSEQLHDSLRRIAKEKPVVAVVDGLAASGGYIAAIAADQIVAQDTSLVGSIGVLFQYPNFHALLEKLGVNVETVRSTPLKAAPNGFEPTSPEARAAVESIVKDAYEWFKTMVRDRRRLDEELLARAADGRVFTGRQALELKLVDRLGDEKVALEWLQKEKGIDPNLKVRDWRLRSRFSDLDFLHMTAIRMLDMIGLRALARRIESSAMLQAIERANLDGLLALWHPSISN
ncbi:MAG: signal peptide peptidase SppA [Variibacter sp.]|nr:signal peptide peptidase SppA [Variibacter sp.]